MVELKLKIPDRIRNFRKKSKSPMTQHSGTVPAFLYAMARSSDPLHLNDVASLVGARKAAGKIYDATQAFYFRPVIYSKLSRADPEFHASNSNVAQMCKNAYRGFRIRKDDAEEDDKEKALMKLLKIYERVWDIQNRFKTIAYGLGENGNMIAEHMEPRVNKEIPGPLQWWPLTHTTIHERPITLGMPGSHSTDDFTGIQMFDNKLFVLNETNIHFGNFGEQKEQKSKRSIKINAGQRVRQRERMLHFRLNYENQITIDKGGRYTFGVWGVSPMEPLITDLLWKQNIKILDIDFRAKVIPLRHFKLDGEGFGHRHFEGNREEQAAASTSAAQNSVKNFIVVLESVNEGGQELVTLNNVEGMVLEAKTTKYMQPNELLDQINTTISAVTGMPKSALTGEGRGSFAAEIITSNYTVMRARDLAEVIKSVFIKAIISDIKTRIPNQFDEDLLNRIDMELHFVMERDLSERSRALSLLYTIVDEDGNCLFDEDELRTIVGHLPRTEVQKKNPYKTGMEKPDLGKGPMKDPKEQMSHEKDRSASTYPQTQDSKKTSQKSP